MIDSATATYRALSEDCGFNNRPTTQLAIGKIVKKFQKTGVVTNIERPVNHRFGRSAENTAIVSESVAKTRICQFLRNAQKCGLSCGTL